MRFSCWGNSFPAIEVLIVECGDINYLSTEREILARETLSEPPMRRLVASLGGRVCTGNNQRFRHVAATRADSP